MPDSRSIQPDHLRRLEPFALAGIACLSAVLALANIGNVGLGNLYYAAGARSMSTSLHNLFFVSFDPAGFLAIDKPPAAFWIQVAFVKVLGFNGPALMLPSAIAGVASVLVLNRIVRRSFGATAGLVAALVLAVTPVNVATARNNTPDGILVLVLLLAAWACLAAIDRRDLRLLLASAALLGLGFNVKMLQAYLAVPALAITYALCAHAPARTRALHLVAAGVVAVAVSASWMAVVELTPANRRPYLGGSTTNSPVELATSYNGVGRFRFSTAPGGAGGPASLEFGGSPGILRMLNAELGGQASWLLPLAFVGFLGVLRGSPPAGLVLWIVWAGTHAAAFSLARGVFHPYYLAQYTPAVAALCGAGFVALLGWARGALLPWLAASAAVEVLVLQAYPPWRTWMSPMVVVSCVGLGVAAVVKPSAHPGVTGAALSVLLVAPLAWSAVTVASPPSPIDPRGGPQPARAASRPAFPDLPQVSVIASRLLAGGGAGRFVAAMPSALAAAPIVARTGAPILAYGGFLGFDPALSSESFERLVADRAVRFVILYGPGTEHVVSRWVRHHCRPLGEVYDCGVRLA